MKKPLLNELKFREKSIEWDRIKCLKKQNIQFLLFNNLYDTNSFETVKGFEYLSKVYDYQKVNFGLIAYPSNFKLTITNFFDINEICSIRKEYIEIFHENENFADVADYIPIAQCSLNTYLLLGNTESKFDKLFIYDLRKKKTVLVASDIFEFIKSIFIEPKAINHLKSFLNLYKNWGEDFWRIKEDGDTSSLIEEKNQEIAQIKEEKDKYYYQLKKLARAEKISGVPLELLSEKYGFSLEDLEKSYF